MTTMMMTTTKRKMMTMMMTSRWGETYSGRFLVYKAFNPLVHTSLTERKCVSIQGVKKKTEKTVYISCFYAVQFFFLLFV